MESDSNLPQSIQTRPGGLTLVVVFERPLDFPDHYVVRRQFVPTGGHGIVEIEFQFHAFESEAAAHEHVLRCYPDATLLHGRDADPDPHIVAVYL